MLIIIYKKYISWSLNIIAIKISKLFHSSHRLPAINHLHSFLWIPINRTIVRIISLRVVAIIHQKLLQKAIKAIFHSSKILISSIKDFHNISKGNTIPIQTSLLKEDNHILSNKDNSSNIKAQNTPHKIHFPVRIPQDHKLYNPSINLLKILLNINTSYSLAYKISNRLK